MKKKSIILFCLVLATLVQSCREEPQTPEVPQTTRATVSFDALWDGQPFQMQQVYVDDFGNRLRTDKFMNYVSLIKLVKEDGSEVLVKDFMLVDFYNENIVSAEIPAGKYTALKFGIGVPRDNNKDQDPAQYPSSSPLSVAGSQGMFWTWNTGYIFAKFEGKCDTTGTEGQELLTPIAIHTGDDFSYREYTSEPFSLQLDGTTHAFAIHLNVDRIFSPLNGNDVNIALDAITHGSTNPDLTNNFMDNFLAALSFQP
jgi:hypothetical protein